MYFSKELFRSNVEWNTSAIYLPEFTLYPGHDKKIQAIISVSFV